jgi:5-methyltetrahydropteroyltriglutamate--homocysteine methyltransferase
VFCRITSYRAEVIGSPLRPGYLKQARLDLAAARLSIKQFKQIEDRAVDESIKLQQDNGLDVVTDGEMRRLALSVRSPTTLTVLRRSALIPSRGIRPRPGRRNWVPFTVTGKLHRRRSLAAEEFIYARARAGLPLKMTLPSPLMPVLGWSPEFSAEAYPEPFEPFADAATILRMKLQKLRVSAANIFKLMRLSLLFWSIQQPAVRCMKPKAFRANGCCLRRRFA